jgi:hypothetical protein
VSDNFGAVGASVSDSRGAVVSAGDVGRLVDGAVGGALAGVALELPGHLLEAIAQRAAELVAEKLSAQAAGGEDRWLSTRDAAAYAGCTVNALHKAMARGEVEFEQEGLGAKAWFRKSHIDRWRARGG